MKILAGVTAVTTSRLKFHSRIGNTSTCLIARPLLWILYEKCFYLAKIDGLATKVVEIGGWKRMATLTTWSFPTLKGIKGI